MFNDLTSSISEQEVRQKTQKVVQLVEISAILNSTLKPDILLKNILDTAADLLECGGVSILLYDEREKELRFARADLEKEKREVLTWLDLSTGDYFIMPSVDSCVRLRVGDPGHYVRLGGAHLRGILQSCYTDRSVTLTDVNGKAL